jgi:hypothetical protein
MRAKSSKKRKARRKPKDEPSFVVEVTFGSQRLRPWWSKTSKKGAFEPKKRV